MRPLVTPEQMTAADRATIAAGTPAEVLMKRAGHALARAALRTAGSRYGSRVIAVCGKGNNGGDGFAAATVLLDQGVDARCLVVVDPEDITGAARAHLELFRRRGGRVEPFSEAALARADVVIDALFGTGFTGSAAGTAADAIEAIDRVGAPVVAADIPSGVDGSTGEATGAAVRATTTVAFGAEKIGTAVGAGAGLSGRVEVADIGISVTDADVAVVEPSDATAAVPHRAVDAHKRSGGSVVVIAGSDEMTGAASLTARGALRMGSGYVTLGTTTEARRVAASEMPELIVTVVSDDPVLGPDAFGSIKGALERATAIAIGPGLGTGGDQRALLERVLGETDLPVVVDADGLNVLAADPRPLSRDAATIVTPHPAELARLLDSSVETIQGDRVGVAKAGARRLGCIVVLKGFRTVIARPDGRVLVNPTGGPELATAGTGDVLAGATAALAGMGLDAFTAAWLGAYVHGVAGSLASTRRGTAGVIASDVADALGEAADLIAEAAWS
ncbi:MAG TPA: NAD(P)H-hydrate dehydratase [Actinomycetota bacterium]|nr:NAD(P)H-hydrate dehydratase [Actinomycetota bacterium]